MLEDVLFNTITTKRLRSGAGIQKMWQNNLVDQPCLIQPISPEFAQKTGMVYGRTYNCMVEIDTDIEISDKVVDELGKKYQVTGTMNRNYGYTVQHVTYLLTEESQATPDV